ACGSAWPHRRCDAWRCRSARCREGNVAVVLHFERVRVREDHSDLLLLLTLCNLCSISAERALAAFCVLSDRPLAAISIARGGSFWHIHAGTGIPGRRDSQRMGNPFRCGICQDRLLAAT